MPASPTPLVSFNGTNGSDPTGSLVMDAQGDLFGTTSTGGANGDGTVFEIVNTGTPTAPVYSGTPTTLVGFNGTDGANPATAMFYDAKGDLLGTTASEGGSSNDGTAFEITPTGNGGYSSTPTTLVAFNGMNGANPSAALVADASGNLYGTTNNGVVFEIREDVDGLRQQRNRCWRRALASGSAPSPLTSTANCSGPRRSDPNPFLARFSSSSRAPTATPRTPWWQSPHIADLNSRKAA